MFLNMSHKLGNSIHLRARRSGEEGKGSRKLKWEKTSNHLPELVFLDL